MTSKFMTDDRIKKVKESFQFLRGKGHALLDEMFPDGRERYQWLRRNFPVLHLSGMNKKQLGELIIKLEKIKNGRA